MKTYYLDTSALSKRYVDEPGSAWVRALVAPAAGNALLFARATMVELYSALARRRREGSITSDARLVASQSFALHCVIEYQFVELDSNVVAIAQRLLDNYPLRAYDAIQLASALRANTTLLATHLPALCFVSADDRLTAAASAEGLAVENPNSHA